MESAREAQASLACSARVLFCSPYSLSYASELSGALAVLASFVSLLAYARLLLASSLAGWPCLGIG